MSAGSRRFLAERVEVCPVGYLLDFHLAESLDKSRQELTEAERARLADLLAGTPSEAVAED